MKMIDHAAADGSQTENEALVVKYSVCGVLDAALGPLGNTIGAGIGEVVGPAIGDDTGCGDRSWIDEGSVIGKYGFPCCTVAMRYLYI